MRAALIAGVSFCGIVGQARAEEQPAGVEEASENPADIVVSARKRDERLTDVPLAVTAFSQDWIERSNLSNANDLAVRVPNFTVVEQQSPGVALIYVRGIGQVRNGEPPVSVVVDGVQISNSYAITQDFGDIAQVEVLKGPQGAVYGRNSIGGALVITTQAPSDELAGSASVSYGTADDWRLKANIRGPLVGHKITFKLGVDFRDFGGDIPNVMTGHGGNFDRHLTIRAGVMFKPTDDLSIDIRYARLRQDAGGALYSARPDGQANVPGAWASRIDNLGWRDIDDLTMKIDYDFGGASLTSITGYSRVNAGLDQDLGPSGLPVDAHQAISTKGISQEVRLVSAKGSPFQWMVGGYFLDVDYGQKLDLWLQTDPTQAFGAGLPIQDTQTGEDRRSYAVFGSTSYRFDSGLELSGAFRYDIDDQHSRTLVPGGESIKFKSFQPRVTMSYFFGGSNRQHVYASVARGYRAGGFNASPVFAPTYSPEKVWTYEAGYKGNLADGRVSAAVSAFYNDITDRQLYALTFQDTNNDGTVEGYQIISNPLKKAESYGVEADLTIVPVKGALLQASVGWLKTKVKKYDPTLFGGNYVGNEIPYSPEWSYSLTGEYRIDLSSVSVTPRVELNGFGKSWWEIDNADRRKGIQLLNLRLRFDYENFHLTGYVENLFKERYNVEFVPKKFSGAPNDIGAAAPGRRWGIQAGVKF